MLKPKNQVNLIDPDSKPGCDVVIWDGECNFCRSQVERLTWWDGGNRLTYLSLHDSRVKERYPELSHEELMKQLWVVTPDGRKFGGADAIRYLSCRLPRLWIFAPLMHIPFTQPLWRGLYGIVARRRYKIAGHSCESGTCDLHGKH